MTEKEVEEELVTETRTLTMPNGEKKAVTCFRILWNSFDMLQEIELFTREAIIEMADGFARRKNIPFEKGLESICGYAHQELKKM